MAKGHDARLLRSAAAKMMMGTPKTTAAAKRWSPGISPAVSPISARAVVEGKENAAESPVPASKAAGKRAAAATWEAEREAELARLKAEFEEVDQFQLKTELV